MKSPILRIVEEVKSGAVTARVQVEKAFRRIDETKDYNVIIGEVRERALARADEIDQRIKDGEDVGRLAGVPFIAKDNFLTFGGETTAASNILRGFEAPYQSTAVERLEAAGAIVVAKANLDAFAHGASTENSDFGPTKNPVNPQHVPGGSSGGSAAAVALGIVPFALGTDTGGSIRLPASYCGVVGLKPTYGLVSRYGVVAMASSTDVIGPLTKTVKDAALILDIMSGKDPRDGTTIDRHDNYTDLQATPLKIGVVKEFMGEGLDPETKKRVEEQIEKLKKLGHEVGEVSIPAISIALGIYYVVVPAEVSSNLARYDGIKYGHRSNDAANLEEVYGKSRGEGFNAENKRRIMVGNYVLSSGYYDAYYRKAQTARTVLINEFAKAFDQFDLLVGPTGVGPAFKLGQNTHDPVSMYLVDIMTVGASVAGLPAISIPAGEVEGLPVGVQLIGRQHDDRQLLAVSRALQEANNG